MPFRAGGGRSTGGTATTFNARNSRRGAAFCRHVAADSRSVTRPLALGDVPGEGIGHAIPPRGTRPRFAERTATVLRWAVRCDDVRTEETLCGPKTSVMAKSTRGCPNHDVSLQCAAARALPLCENYGRFVRVPRWSLDWRATNLRGQARTFIEPVPAAKPAIGSTAGKAPGGSRQGPAGPRRPTLTGSTAGPPSA